MSHPETRVMTEHGDLPRVLAVGGYLVRYGRPIWGLETANGIPYTEVFVLRAFREGIARGGDVVATIGGVVLRKAEGGVVLKEEIDGVSYSLRVADGPEGQALLEACVKAKDVTFTFHATKEWWTPPIVHGEKEPEKVARLRAVMAGEITGIEIVVE